MRVLYPAAVAGPVTEQARAIGTQGAVDGIVAVGMVLDRAMIVTQNCDLLNEERMRDIPTINVVPVFDAIKALGDTEEVRNGLKSRATYLYYVRLIKPDLPSPAGERPVWVADLRFEFPIERSLLVNRRPIAGFCDGAAYVTCARRVAAYRGRAALDDKVRSDIVEPFVAALKSLGLKNAVAELWVECKPDPLKAETTILHIVLNDLKDSDHANELLGRWYTEFIRTYFEKYPGSDQGNGPLPPRVHPPGIFDAEATYRTAQRVDWPPA